MASEVMDTPIEVPTVSLAHGEGDVRADKATHVTTEHGDVDKDGAATHDGLEAQSGHGGYHIYGLFFIFIIMTIGQTMKRASGWTGVPYTTLVTVLGLVLGTICQYPWMGYTG